MVKLPSSVSRLRGRGKTPLALRPALCPCSLSLPAALTAPSAPEPEAPRKTPTSLPQWSPIAPGPFSDHSPPPQSRASSHLHTAALAPLLSLSPLFLSLLPLFLSSLLPFCFVLSIPYLIFLCLSGHLVRSLVGVRFCLAFGSLSWGLRCVFVCVCWCALS